MNYKNNNIYFVGITNSGKSTLINEMIKSYNGVDGNITVSNYPSTTLSVVDVRVGDIIIKDTPGIVINNSFVNIISDKDIKKINNKKEIKPITIQIKDKGAILVSEFIRIEYETSESSLTFYMSNNLDISNISFKNPRLANGNIREFYLKDNEDLVIEDIGFIKFTKETKIKIYTLKEVYMYVREKLI
jgi:ribosome biogenesis GTPase A